MSQLKYSLYLSVVFSSIIVEPLHAQLVDTLFSVSRLDGDITFWYLDSGYFVSTRSSEIVTGDGRDWDHQPNFYRGYIAFDLKTTSTDTIQYRLVSAIVGIYQIRSVGDDTLGKFPVFKESYSFPCILDHVDYGDTLNWLDWEAGDIGNPKTICSRIGSISTTATLEYKTMAVTDHVLEDLRAGTRYTQFRIRFPVDHDNDLLQDLLMFAATDGSPPQQHLASPFLRLEWGKVQSVGKTNEHGISSFILHQNYPNPFNNETKIEFEVPKPGKVTFSIYNTLGELIRKEVNEFQSQGMYVLSWNGKDERGKAVASSVYFGKLTFGEENRYVKMILLK